MGAFLNLAKMTVLLAPGTGSTITLNGAAIVGGVQFLTFAQAGAVASAVYDYAILDPTNGGSEIGTITYPVSGLVLTGRTPTKSTNGNAAINASVDSLISISPRAESLNDASVILTGTMATARLGSGTADATTALFGDQTYKPIDPPFPSGTVMLFYQASAPTGWTKVTTQNDKALRVVSGTGGVSGGTNAFSTVMAQTVVGSTSLSTAQLASHSHTQFGSPNSGCGTLSQGNANGTSSAQGSVTAAAGSGSSHNHSITMSIQYIDLILASKN